MTDNPNITNVTSLENARPKGPSTFDVVFGMEEDIQAVIDYTSVLANGLLDEDVPSDIGSGLCRVACEARHAGERLKGRFEAALELARQDKRA